MNNCNHPKENCNERDDHNGHGNHRYFCCNQEVYPASFGMGWVWLCPVCKKVLKNIGPDIDPENQIKKGENGHREADK